MAIPVLIWPISTSLSKHLRIPYFSFAEIKTKMPAQLIYLLLLAKYTEEVYTETKSDIIYHHHCCA